MYRSSWISVKKTGFSSPVVKRIQLLRCVSRDAAGFSPAGASLPLYVCHPDQFCDKFDSGKAACYCITSLKTKAVFDGKTAKTRFQAN